MVDGANVPLLAWTETGLLVTSEGSLLLAYDAETEAPEWKLDLEADVLAIAGAGDRVVAITSLGRLFEIGSDGARVAMRFARGARGVVATSETRCVFGADACLVEKSGRERPIRLARVTAAAFSDDGARLCVGSASGEVWIVDPKTGEKLASSSAPGPITGLSWSAIGYFVAMVRFAHGGFARVDEVSGTFKPLVGMGDVGADAVSVSEDGRFVAARLTDGRAVVFDVVGNRPVAKITYVAPEIAGQIAFGPKTWLAIALGHGDANKIDLATGAVHRTDPHEGRTRHRWALMADVQSDRVLEVIEGRTRSKAIAKSAERPPAAPEPPAISMHLVISIIMAIVGLLAALARHR